MDTIEKPMTDTIKAKFNYVVGSDRPAIRYIDWPEMADKEIPPQYKQHMVTIRNGRPLRDTFRLDTHGFVFADHHTKMKDFTDEAERKAEIARVEAEIRAGVERDREIVRKAAVDAGKQEIALARAGLVEAGRPLLKDIEGLGVKVTTLNAAQREQFVAATRSVYTKWKPQVGAPLVDKAEKVLAGVK